MAMTVNRAATPGTAAPFRDEGLYVFRFDTDGDAREDVSFKVRFGQIAHRHDENDHVQSLPLITHLFIREPEMRDYNRSAPSGDNDRSPVISLRS